MKFLDILKESREDVFKQTFERKFGQQNTQRIIDLIEPKFLNWVGKVLDNMNFDQNLMKVKQNLDEFKKYSTNLAKTDISQYGSIDELDNSIKTYKEKPRRSYKQVEGGNVVYEDDRFFVINPLTHIASCYYGKGTKWCTAAETDTQFSKYNDDGKLFYILDKSKATNDPLYKIALLKKFEGDEIFYDAKDDVIRRPLYEYWGEPIYKSIMQNILEYLNTEFEEQIKIFTDKEKARKERERIETLRRKREEDRKKEEAEERRLNNEWDLNGDDCDDECLEANAVLRHLEDNGYNVLNDEDKRTIESMRNEIETLTNEYNDSEDVRGDLLDRISDLEDLLDEYSEYIDVYSLYPDGSYYEMGAFEVVGSGERYAAGSTRKMDDTVRDYVEGLLDDVGYDGFSKSFVEDSIDEEAVVDYFREFYEDDIYDSPDSYFEDSQRELSTNQREKISNLNRKIQSHKNIIETLSSQEESEEINEKIEELELEIEEFEEEIEEIESDPQGDYPQDLIDEKVEEMLEDVRQSPKNYLDDHGMDIENYIDREKFIDSIIDADGYGLASPYDGGYDEYRIKDRTIYVFRID